jgi:hypothetical protein
MNTVGFDLLQEVEALLHTDAASSYEVRLLSTSGGVAATTQRMAASPSSSFDNGNIGGGAFHSIMGAPSLSPIRTDEQQQRVAASQYVDNVEPNVTSWPSSEHRERAVEETIDEMLRGDEGTFAVLDALLTTARQNTDLTETDIVCRRIRESEIEQLSQGIAVLEAHNQYIKRRCNILYDEINHVNDQQSQLVACLEAALEATPTVLPASSQTGGRMEPRRVPPLPNSHRYTTALKNGSFQGGGDLHQQLSDDQGSAGSLRPSRLGAALSASSSQSGAKQMLPKATQEHLLARVVTNEVTPYSRVLGGPLDRGALNLLSPAGGSF